MNLLKSVRPDLFDLGEDLYIVNRVRAQNTLQVNAEREGSWLTLDGMYQQVEGTYEVADVVGDDFQI